MHDYFRILFFSFVYQENAKKSVYSVIIFRNLLLNRTDMLHWET